MALEDLNWLCLSLIKDIPVIHSAICDKAQGCLAEPFPEHNILIHCRRLELRLLGKVEYLKRPRLCLEGNDLFCPVHNGTVGLDRSSRDIVILL